MKKELLFNTLFNRALEDWPQELEIKKITIYDNGQYGCEEAWELYLKTDDVCLNQPLAVLMMDLHYEIYGALRSISKFYKRIHFKDLRPETIQQRVKEKLKDALDDPEGLGWKEQDIQLVKDYFAVNYPDEPLP